MYETYQVGEVVAALSCHEAMREAKADDILHVGVQARRVGLEHNVDQGRQEVVGIGWLTVGGRERLEHVLAALGHAHQLVLRGAFGVHLDNGCYSGKKGVAHDGALHVRERYAEHLRGDPVQRTAKKQNNRK